MDFGALFPELRSIQTSDCSIVFEREPGLAQEHACVGSALLFATKIPVLRPMVLPIYRRKGIIPEIDEGLQSALGLLRSERR